MGEHSQPGRSLTQLPLRFLHLSWALACCLSEKLVQLC